ncbi:Uncharacterised protein [Chlamydia abortus]|jgi:hypothetical protein|uniref:Uncharacterized protein n=1 Tax=Paenibacillus residui TaxID=629724 RepID=A0ABW3DBF5_9BACL|nr:MULTISPECIES: hypothetical protein [Paenibacillaceae]SHE10438.1 Uncharacterised protein [Chlamydia abortus]
MADAITALPETQYEQFRKDKFVLPENYVPRAADKSNGQDAESLAVSI